MKKLLFVCLGNICRSPAGEGIMQKMIENQGLEDNYSCDSAGTSAYHQGEPADSRMRKHAKKRGYMLTSVARQFVAEDFDNFDYILTMDQSNYRNVLAVATSDEQKNKVYSMTKFCTRHTEQSVPDPYYGGDAGFEKVLDILEDSCEEMLRKLQSSEI